MKLFEQPYLDIVKLKNWGKSQADRNKASRIFKVAERWYIKKYGFDEWYYILFGGNEG